MTTVNLPKYKITYRICIAVGYAAFIASLVISALNDGIPVNAAAWVQYAAVTVTPLWACWLINYKEPLQMTAARAKAQKGFFIAALVAYFAEHLFMIVNTLEAETWQYGMGSMTLFVLFIIVSDQQTTADIKE